MANAHDVAQAIIEELGGRADKMKLQKLLYYVQGWYVTWNDEPLFAEDIQAWAMGPVVYDVWGAHESYPSNMIRGGNPHNLTPSQRTHVSMVVERYGRFSGAELKRLTHREDPWKEARGDMPPNRRSNSEISTESLKRWFSSISFTPETEEDAVDDDLILAVLEGAPGALGDLIEDTTGVRPIDC